MMRHQHKVTLCSLLCGSVLGIATAFGAEDVWVNITRSICGSARIAKNVKSVTDFGKDLPSGHLLQGTNYEYKLVGVGEGFRTESLAATGTPRKVVLLVRGYGPYNVNYWATMKGFLANDGFEVWDPTEDAVRGDSSVVANAQRLQTYIRSRIHDLEDSGQEGPQRISIVAHSMGGLVTREFMARGSPVPIGEVVMLSPANCGSWLAYVPSSIPVWVWLPLAMREWVSTYDLQFESVLVFNRYRHVLPDRNWGTRYYTIAGTRFDDLGNGVPGLYIAGKDSNIANDGVISVKSSFGQVSPAVASKVFPSQDVNRVMANCGVEGFTGKELAFVNHLAIHTNTGVYQSYVRPMLMGDYNGAKGLAFAAKAEASEQGSATAGDQWQTCAIFNGGLIGGVSSNHTFLVDAASKAQFILGCSVTGSIQFSLRSPAGVQIDQTSVATLSNVIYSETEDMKCYLISDPEIGSWTGVVSCAGSATGIVYYSGMTAVSNDLSFDVDCRGSFHPTNASIPIAGTLNDGGLPLTNASVSVAILKPDRSSSNTTLLDDGMHGDGGAMDGVYGHAFTDTRSAGSYAVDAKATGMSPSGHPFQREGKARFNVFVPSATLTDTYADYGIDDPLTNGLIDTFVIEVGILASATGTYTVAGTLTDTNGTEITSASTDVGVTVPGLVTGKLEFAAGPIYDSRALGGFDLCGLILGDTGDNPAPLDSRTSAYATAGYDWNWFEPSDKDGDRLSNIEERDIYGTNPEQADSDADGVNDYDEIKIYGTNPLKPDTDDDGLPDGWEVANSFNPLVADSDGDADGDGLNNVDEYAWSTNPHVQDTDGDGITDGMEVHTYGTHPNLADTDEDGLNDHDEVYYDGTGTCNTYNSTNNPTGTDTDANNPDTDGDGMPDGWEVAHGLNPLVNDAEDDPDKDGLSNLIECKYELNPQEKDTNGDGIPDGWALEHLMNARSGADGDLDYDGDGMLNRAEYVADTDPTNQNSTLSMTMPMPDTNGTRIFWQGGVMATQYLERGYGLSATSGQWQVLFTNQPPTADSTNVLDRNATNVPIFYRVRVTR